VGKLPCVVAIKDGTSSHLFDATAIKFELSRESLARQNDRFNKRKYIFPGSFNPIHSTHQDIAVKAREIIGNRTNPLDSQTPLIDFEICINNVDKPLSNYYTIASRLKTFELVKKSNPVIGDVYFTSLPTFMDKANYFYNTTFIVGWDTFKRICDPKYADLDEVSDTFEKQNTRFIVFHRIINGVSSADEGTEGLDPRIVKFAEFVSPESLPPTDVSSSSIRSKNNA
jgi:nicotinic acid mononucleotide adenylyltransferase